MALNTFTAVSKYIVPKNHALSCYFHATLQLHNLTVNYSKELFKPSKDSASLRVCNEKKIFVLSFFVGNVINEVGFWPFWLMLPSLD